MTVKICHVTSAHNTNDIRIFEKECVSLAKSEENKVFLVGQGECRMHKKVNVIGVGNIPDKRLKRMMFFAKTVIDKAIELDADIYHLHDPELLRYALKLKKLGKKVIFDSHENVLDSIDEKTYMPLFARKIFKSYYRCLQKKVLKKIDGIIVVTPQMIDGYKEYNNNISMVTNYPIINEFVESSGYIKGRFIFAGGISRQWSHKEIIRAIDKIDDVEYYLFGPADEEYLKELKSLDGWEKVHYGGKVPFEIVQGEIKKAQAVFALLKPSKNSFYMQGTLGNTIFEAMENSKPVVASDFELWKPIIENNDCGICVNPNDVSEIETAIRKVLSLSDEEYDFMGTRSRKAIEKSYNWNIAEKELISFYDRLIN